MQGIIVQNYPFPDYEPATRAAVINTCIKMKKYFDEHDNIQISYSGGADSDCILHLVCTYFPEYLDKCHFVFVNTGLEYRATLKHISEQEKKYGITIDKIRGKSVVTACREKGFPILSKHKSHFIDLYLRDKPSGYNIIFGGAIRSYHAMQFTENQKEMVKFLKDNGIRVSAYCCDISKKKPMKQYQKQHEIDMIVTGERQAEGGQRALIHKSCFEEQNKIDKYMPLWWWSDEVKIDFKEKEHIKYSDCYEVYGMKRTGCCGCPFNLNIADDLQAMYEHEPRLFRACMKVFGQSYELMDRFNCRRKKCLPDSFQMTITGEIERNE